MKKINLLTPLLIGAIAISPVSCLTSCKGDSDQKELVTVKQKSVQLENVKDTAEFEIEFKDNFKLSDGQYKAPIISISDVKVVDAKRSPQQHVKLPELEYEYVPPQDGKNKIKLKLSITNSSIISNDTVTGFSIDVSWLEGEDKQEVWHQKIEDCRISILSHCSVLPKSTRLENTTGEFLKTVIELNDMPTGEELQFEMVGYYEGDHGPATLEVDFVLNNNYQLDVMLATPSRLVYEGNLDYYIEIRCFSLTQGKRLWVESVPILGWQKKNSVINEIIQDEELIYQGSSKYDLGFTINSNLITSESHNFKILNDCFINSDSIGSKLVKMEGKIKFVEENISTISVHLELDKPIIVEHSMVQPALRVYVPLEIDGNIECAFVHYSIN